MSLNSQFLRPVTKGPDGPLGCIVIDRQMAGLDVAFKSAPVARKVVHCFAQCFLRRDLRLGFLQLGLELIEERWAVLLAAPVALFIADILEFALDAVELVDHHPQRDISTPGLPLSCTFCVSTNLRRACALCGVLDKSHYSESGFGRF